MVGHEAADKRIKYYEENGTEVVDKDDPYLFLRYEAADPASSKRKAESVGASSLVFVCSNCSATSEPNREAGTLNLQQQSMQ